MKKPATRRLFHCRDPPAACLSDRIPPAWGWVREPLGAWAAEIFRTAKAPVRSIFPPLLDPWSHHGLANRRKSVLAQSLFRLESFCRPSS